MQGLLDDLGCSCWRRTLDAEKRGELTVFTCETCVDRARLWHGGDQLSFFPEGERESSVSALVASGGVKKKSVAGALPVSLESLPF